MPPVGCISNSTFKILSLLFSKYGNTGALSTLPNVIGTTSASLYSSINFSCSSSGNLSTLIYGTDLSAILICVLSSILNSIVESLNVILLISPLYINAQSDLLSWFVISITLVEGDL